MLKGLIRNWQISLLISRRDSEYRDLSFNTIQAHRIGARDAIDEAFIQGKKNILAGKVDPLDFIWTFIKCEVRDIYWWRRKKRMERYVDYNTPHTLHGRTVISSCFRGVAVGDNDMQYSVDVFYKLFDKAKKQIKRDRLRVGLELT